MFTKGGNITTESFLGLSQIGEWTRMHVLDLHLRENDSSSNSGQIMKLYIAYCVCITWRCFVAQNNLFQLARNE